MKGMENKVNVYCRIRHVKEQAKRCAWLIDMSTIQTVCPKGVKKPHTFTKVFDTDTKQEEVFEDVAKPLVENLIQRKNGLLFAHGATGSGKTFTMCGPKREGERTGVIPQALKMLFQKIGQFQSKKTMFKPDDKNGMKVVRRLPKLVGAAEACQPEDVDPRCCYSVFVSFVEIYKGFAYDLLEQALFYRYDRQHKHAHKDENGCWYVACSTQIEVKSKEEALSIFEQGQRYRTTADNKVHSKSSRSHGLFTVKLVCAPVCNGKLVPKVGEKATVSQLCLVDLAGCESIRKSDAGKERIEEACVINKDLMVLKRSVKILRENQSGRNKKMVPFRESILTQVLRSYFEKKGIVRVIVCIDPKEDCYTACMNAMQFALSTQKVRVARPTEQTLLYTAGEEDGSEWEEPEVLSHEYELNERCERLRVTRPDRTICQRLVTMEMSMHRLQNRLTAIEKAVKGIPWR